jgi:hypothetical protein
MLLARIIVGWHVRIGMDTWQQRFGQGFSDHQDERSGRYRQAVARFHESDLSDVGVQLVIAREQIAGAMEWACGMTVPDQIPGFERVQPCLGDIARKLEMLARRSHEEERRGEGRTVVRYSSREDLLATTRQVYAAVTGRDVQGGGGLSFLLSCSLERASPESEGQVILLSPEILGVSPLPSGRVNDLLEQLGSEGLEILEVTGS